MRGTNFLLVAIILLISSSLNIKAKNGDDTIFISDLNIVMLPIKPGNITLKNVNSDQSIDQVNVTLSKFWMAKTEVTQAQYEAIMGDNPSHFRGSDLPMEQLSWEDAMAFCYKLNEREKVAGNLPKGYHYILPAEAQWEYACRAGTTGDYAGDINQMAWFDKNSGAKSHPVGTKQPNAWGLYDMHGNVQEYCLDWFGIYPGGSETDYSGVASGTRRVLRGGCWEKPVSACNSSKRGRNPQGRREDLVGFRIALSSIPEIKITMIPVPPGTFVMGNTFENDEKNLTKVSLSKYWLGQTEITQSQFKTIMGYGSPHFQGPDMPMDCASWLDAMAFCEKYTEIEREAGRLPYGYVYTLPTEAQWEYACRAGNTDNTGYDIDNMDALAWFKDNSDSRTHSVGSKMPNAWGFYDMHGNLRELCLDWYADYPGGSVTDYRGPSSGVYHSVRGGCWSDSAETCATTNRGYRSEGRRAELLGFRIALSAIEE